MNVYEFKDKYPQYANLEGEDLWNKMEDTLLSSDNALYADPNQEKIWLDPIEIPILQEDGTYKNIKVVEEDSSKTRWLNKDGNLVRVGEGAVNKQKGKPIESYRMIIWDASKQQHVE